MTRTIRSLETEFASSSTRMDNMEHQITQLQQDLQQIKMDPLNKTDPPSRRSSVDSTTSGPPITPELMAKKMRTLYFRGFPIDTKQNILQWMNQHEISNVEETYTLGHLSDTAVVVFKDESSLWTFLRQCPNNKWRVYGTSQIYVGLDNQIRGQRPEENKSIRSYTVPVFKFSQLNTLTKIFLRLMFIEIIVGALLKSIMVWIGRKLLTGIHVLINLFSQRTILNTNQPGGHSCADYVLISTLLSTIPTFTGTMVILLAKPSIRALALRWRASTSHLLHYITKNYFITMLFWYRNRDSLHSDNNICRCSYKKKVGRPFGVFLVHHNKVLQLTNLSVGNAGVLLSYIVLLYSFNQPLIFCLNLTPFYVHIVFSIEFYPLNMAPLFIS